jgi:hypothetical protein
MPTERPREWHSAKRHAEQQKALQSFGEKISGLVNRLKAMSEATVESRMTEVRSLREALVQLGTQLQPDAPFSQGLDQFQSWISPQMGRMNSQRATLVPEFAMLVLLGQRPGREGIQPSELLILTLLHHRRGGGIPIGASELALEIADDPQFSGVRPHESPHFRGTRKSLNLGFPGPL